MEKVIAKKVDKIWGYEVWLYSTVPGMETETESGRKTTKGPLIKIIQANMALSVQVHPDDKLARALENQPNGKSEAWYILDHTPKASIVTGLKNYNPDTIKQMLSEGTFESNLELTTVSKGQFFNIPAGLVHGIGAGIKVLEVQQPSDTTYRYYDYMRLENGKPRELHIDKALQSQKQLSWELQPTSRMPLTYRNDVGTQKYMTSPTVLVENSIIIDIESEQAYVAHKGEEVNFKNYAIISFN